MLFVYRGVVVTRYLVLCVCFVDVVCGNMCEGWNNKFFNLVGHAHPSTCIWRVIEWCQTEEATVCTIIQQDAVGNPPAKRTQQRHVQLQVRL